MSDSVSKPRGVLLKYTPTAALLLALLAPLSGRAEPFLVLHSSVHALPAPETIPQIVKRPVTVGLNANGDLTIRHSDFSLIVAYSPPGDVIEPQERIRISQKQESPSISGISLKVAFLF